MTTRTLATARKTRRRNPVARFALRRLGMGLISVFLVSVIVFWATMVLPGNAATAILGQSATPERIAELTAQLNLDQPAIQRYFTWLGGVLRLDFGQSLANGQSVWELLAPRLINSGMLVLTTTIVSSIIGIVVGAYVAARRDGWLDHSVSVIALVASALPEFVVAIFVILVFSVSVFHWFPAVSIMAAGETVLDNPEQLVLPTLTLVLVVTPYVLRMTRAATIESLQSEYAELARLKGLTPRQVLFRHALPNAMPPAVQAIGLNILYLAGGIVLVETVFNYPGIGTALVSAVNVRDVPVIQFIVLILAVFYVVLNAVSDLVVLTLTPRRREAAS